MRASQIVKEAGSSYLEAPVSGSKQPAEQGTLIFLCGGDQALFDKAGPLLDVMGKAKLFLGNVRPTFSLKILCSSHSITHNCERAQVTAHRGMVWVSRLVRGAAGLEIHVILDIPTMMELVKLTPMVSRGIRDHRGYFPTAASVRETGCHGLFRWAMAPT